MSLRVLTDPFTFKGIGLEDLFVSRFDEHNVPWAYTSEAQFREKWPTEVTVVPLSPNGATFYDRLANTLADRVDRVVVQLEAGVYHLNSFRMAGSSGDPLYAFGFWFGRKLQGFVGRGPDKTIVQMDANSLTQQQLDAMALIPAALFSPLQLGMCRFDGAPGSPVILSGLTFRAADQQMLTAVYRDIDIVVPQPAPHQGVVIYSGGDSIVTHARFQAAGRASFGRPPFEMANLNTQYGTHLWENVEFDGRRAKELDPAQPRRCGVVMANNETSHRMRNCWMHHSNLTRYAVNDQNRDTAGTYEVSGCQSDHISETNNVDPALNGGESLKGVGTGVQYGWESCSGVIRVTGNVIVQSSDLPKAGFGEIPTPFRLTSVGSRNPVGGRFYATDNVYVWPKAPWLNGWAAIRVQTDTHWWTDGVQNTIFFEQNGTRLLPFEYAGSWPPPQSAITAAGVAPTTHYILRRN